MCVSVSFFFACLFWRMFVCDRYLGGLGRVLVLILQCLDSGCPVCVGFVVSLSAF